MTDLPSFKNPPIDEILLSIQFASIEGFKSAHVGMYWDEIQDRFPQVSEQPPINPAFETFGGIRTASAPFRFEALISPPMPRYWFEAPGEPDLLQLQQDRLIRNWRQAPDGTRIYPRYEHVRDAFRNDMATFDSWLRSKGLGKVIPNQCEVTYINIIKLPDGSNPHTQLHRISNVWSENITLPSSEKLEHSLVQLVSIFDHDEKPAGRVYTNFQPAYTQDRSEPVVKLDITARGKPLGETVDDAFSFLDLASAEIVNTFASITTSEMHKFWGRYNA